MAKGLKPDFNNGPGNNSDGGCIFAPPAFIRVQLE